MRPRRGRELEAVPLSIAPVTAAPAPRRTESGRGLAYMLIGMFIFSAVDAQAKYLTQTLPVLQIVWARQFGLLLAVLVLLAIRGRGMLRTRHPVIQISRGVLAVSSSILFIIAVSYVPLADAVAVSFVAPFVVTILGAAILREPVGIRRWTAVIVGFAGALIVIRPGAGVLHPAVLLVLVAASLFAGRQVISRIVADSDKTLTTVAYTALAGGLLVTLPLPFVWQTPATALEVGLLVSVAVMAAAGEAFVIKALEVAQAVVVAPMQYTMLLWGTLYGWLIFAQLPDLWTWIGSAVIVATGLYTFHRERKVAQEARRAARRHAAACPAEG